MKRDDIEKIADEEYGFYSKIYRSFEKKSMPRLSVEDIIEKLLSASQEELVRGRGEDVLKAYAIAVAARALKKVMKG